VPGARRLRDLAAVQSFLPELGLKREKSSASPASAARRGWFPILPRNLRHHSIMAASRIIATGSHGADRLSVW